MPTGEGCSTSCTTGSAATPGSRAGLLAKNTPKSMPIPIAQTNLSTGTLVRPARRARLRCRARRRWEDRLRTRRYRRRSDRRRADGTGLGRPPRGAAQGRRLCIFAGERELDLRRALEILNEDLGIKRLVLEGGGVANGALLRAGLVDELRLAMFPAVDGARGAACVFDSRDDEAGAPRSTR